MGDKEGARTQLDLVMSGKPLEVNTAGRKVRRSPRVHVAHRADDLVLYRESIV